MLTPPSAPPRKAQILDWEGLNPSLGWCYCRRVEDAYLRGEHLCRGVVAWLILRGAVTIRSDSGLLTVNEGNWVVPRPGRIYREIRRDTTLLSLQFKATWADRSSLFGEGLPVVFASKSFPQLQPKAMKLAQFVKRAFGQRGSLLFAAETALPDYLRMQSLFTDWLASFVETLSALRVPHQRQGTMDERVRRGLSLLDHFELGTPFPKTALARELSLSPSQLDRVFVKETGHTPRNYFDQRRLAAARLTLANDSTSIKELAYSLGFRTVSHFSTWFRRSEGVPPSEYTSQSPWL